MNKSILKIFIFIWLFFIIISNVFSFDASLEIDKNEADINNFIKLRITIESDDWWEIWIKEIKWLENFELINQSQSQSTSSSIVVVNWKTERKTKRFHNLDLTLKAQSKWDYEIGPVILINWTNEVITNSVKIKIVWDNLFVNNNHLQIPNTNTQTQVNNNNNNKPNTNTKQDNNIDTYENIEQLEFESNNWIYLFLWLLMVMGVWFYFILKSNPELLVTIFENKKIDKEKKKKDKTSIKNKNLIIEKENFENELDFNKKQKIIYPDISDNEFIWKIIDIFKNKVKFKYKIVNINNKSFEEILSDIWEQNNDLKELVKLINKAKYSNIILDNNKILDLVKEI